MPASKISKIILALVSFISLLIIIILAILVFRNFIQKNNDFNAEINKDIAYIDNDKIQISAKKQLDIINSNQESNVKYDSLRSLYTIFYNDYFNDGNPQKREVLIFIKNHAQDNYEKEFSDYDFPIICNDDECGEDFPKDLENIVGQVQSSPSISGPIKSAILSNIKSANNTQTNNSTEKLNRSVFFTQAYIKLIFVGTQDASSTAKLLKEYVKKTYGAEI